jgi:hypothetical protein
VRSRSRLAAPRRCVLFIDPLGPLLGLQIGALLHCMAYLLALLKAV